MSRRKKKRPSGDVELNLAAMLDMAFQLLTFFILTFKPAPVEGQVTLRLPPPQAVAGRAGTVQAGSDENRKEPVIAVQTLVIGVFATPDGKIAGINVGEDPVQTIPGLIGKLQAVFQDPSNPFEQVIIQVGQDLRYEELMRVVEICAAQTLPDGTKLSKLSFVEVPNG